MYLSLLSSGVSRGRISLGSAKPHLQYSATNSSLSAFVTPSPKPAAESSQKRDSSRRDNPLASKTFFGCSSSGDPHRANRRKSSRDRMLSSPFRRVVAAAIFPFLDLPQPLLEFICLQRPHMRLDQLDQLGCFT